MPRRRPELGRILAALDGMERVATHAQLCELGMTKATAMRRIGPDGPWQRLLPGVVLAHRGTPTRRERLLGALAYAGPDAVVSGADALLVLGVRELEPPGDVLILIKAELQKSSFDYVRIERTQRLPVSTTRRAIRYAPPARALMDLCRHQPAVANVRALVATVVQQGHCGVDDLATELAEAPRQRSAGARQALAEVADGVRSIAEARARDALSRSGLPAPRWNARLVDADGVTFLTPDAWWPDHGAAIEIDSRKWHLSPEAWARTQRRQRLLTAHGVMVMAFAPNEIIEDPKGFVREVRALLRAAAGR